MLCGTGRSCGNRILSSIFFIFGTLLFLLARQWATQFKYIKKSYSGCFTITYAPTRTLPWAHKEAHSPQPPTTKNNHDEINQTKSHLLDVLWWSGLAKIDRHGLLYNNSSLPSPKSFLIAKIYQLAASVRNRAQPAKRHDSRPAIPPLPVLQFSIRDHRWRADDELYQFNMKPTS
jgi:hypothetical protein